MIYPKSIEEQLQKFCDWVWQLSPHNRDRIPDNIKQFIEFNLTPYIEQEKITTVQLFTDRLEKIQICDYQEDDLEVEFMHKTEKIQALIDELKGTE